MRLLSFLDSQTLKTYKEKVEGLEAKTAKRVIKDKLIDAVARPALSATGAVMDPNINPASIPMPSAPVLSADAPLVDDDLPF